LLLAK